MKSLSDQRKRGHRLYRRFIKRFLDIGLSILALIFLSWLFVLVAILIFVDDSGPVIFKQKRIGIHKTTFWCYKFRTMKTSAPRDVPTHLLKNPEQYTTRLGRFLRRSSIDELPQLWNILVNDMSWIGPRPALWNEDDLIVERDKYGANDVMPGLTGWAQINGRDRLKIPEKAKLDGEYVRKMSFRFDCKCFFGTFRAVLRHDGVAESGTKGNK